MVDRELRGYLEGRGKNIQGKLFGGGGGGGEREWIR